MKKTILFLLVFGSIFTQVLSQVYEQSALATRMYYFNSGGLTGQGNEVLSAVGDSSCRTYSGSMKTVEQTDGVYYQVYSTSKFEQGFSRTAFRKSNDGINWSPMIRAGDAPAGKNEYYQSIYVWKKNGNVNVGVIYVDSRADDQVRFARSTNGGTSFLPSVQVSTHSNNSFIYLGGVTGRGDTIAAVWARADGFVTSFSVSTNGGTTWSNTATAFSGGFFNVTNDIMIDNSSNLYVVTGDDQFFKTNLTVRKSTNLGAAWTTMPQITSVTINQMNQFPQSRFFNNKLYTIWERNLNNNSQGNMSDGIMLSESTNGGSNWSAPNDASDTDTLYYSSSNNWPSTMHPAFTVTPSGTIYAVWSDSRSGHSATFDSCKFNVRLSRSTNGGATWSASLLVNTPSNYSRSSSGHASVTVKSSGGTDSVLVMWSKLRNIFVNGITQINTGIPKTFSLSQNYPNPFNPTTNIDFHLPAASNVRIVIYDMLGKEVERLVDGMFKAGSYRVDWNAGSKTSGVYFYRITAGNFTETKKLILIK